MVPISPEVRALLVDAHQSIEEAAERMAQMFTTRRFEVAYPSNDEDLTAAESAALAAVAT